MTKKQKRYEPLEALNDFFFIVDCFNGIVI